MSQQHFNLSQVWQHLQGRHDISNILREIIGDLALQHAESRKLEDSIQKIIWIKTIFDLQRTFLSGNVSSLADCPPYVLSCLLPSELLMSTMLYLVNIKERLFPSQTTLMTREFTRPRHILSQTLLSGLRLLLLRKEDIAARDKRQLQNAINTAWQHDRLHGVELFTVSELFAGTLDMLNEMSDQFEDPYAHERACAKLPAWQAGLYPLDMQPETFVSSLIHGTMDEDWIHAFWVLYDCLWAVEAAVTQRYVDLTRQTAVSGSVQIGADTDEILEQLYHTRTSFILSIFHQVRGPMVPTSALLESLAITLLEWNEDLDSFLSRQDSLVEHPSPSRLIPTRNPGYRKLIQDLKPYLDDAIRTFPGWLMNHKQSSDLPSINRPSVTANDLHEMVKEWVIRMTAPSSETLARELQGSILPVYIVDCPKLHALPKHLLECKLRWCDKWAYESIQENSPTVNWKEGVQCPSCPPGEKIKYARLLEPIHYLSTAFENLHSDNYSLSHYSVAESGSYEATSASMTSRSASDNNSSAMSLPTPLATGGTSTQSTHPTQNSDVFSTASGQPPDYSESPVSPTSFSPISPRSHSHGSSSYIDYPVSPLNESLNVPIPLASRLSVDLPIPVASPSVSESGPESIRERVSISASSDISSIRLNTPSTDSMWSGASVTKSKPASRTVRIANSIRRKPAPKEKEISPFPKDPSFGFSTSGHSLLIWGRDHLVRLDIPFNDVSAVQGCKYQISGIEAAGAGNNKCIVVIKSGPLTHQLLVYNGIKIDHDHEIDIDFSGHGGEICLAVSRNDRYVAVSMNDDIRIFSLENGIKPIPFHNQIQVFELRGGNPHRRTISMARTTSDESITEQFKSETGWFNVQSDSQLSSKEKAEEQRRQSAVVSRKLYFSTDSKQLVVATQLGDHCVYIDVWDCTREPVSTIAEHSRSFKMPPYTLNDGDLTSVFYDSARRNVVCTAFLGKEYPVLVPFPGYDILHNETYSTKIIHAAQSPSGASFIVANAMTEMIQFEYTAKGTLSPRKLKKSSAKMSSSAFKPGAVALAMPLENSLQCFWVKDGKCMLRSVRIGIGETIKDYDLRPHYDRLMSMKKNPVIARAPSLMIPELDAGQSF